MKTTLSNEDVLDRVKEVQYHLFYGTTMTVCCLTLDNGFSVVGRSACVDPARFNAELGERLAYAHAVQLALDHIAFLLREKMHTMDELGIPYVNGDAMMVGMVHERHVHGSPTLTVNPPAQG